MLNQKIQSVTSRKLPHILATFTAVILTGSAGYAQTVQPVGSPLRAAGKAEPLFDSAPQMTRSTLTAPAQQTAPESPKPVETRPAPAPLGTSEPGPKPGPGPMDPPENAREVPPPTIITDPVPPVEDHEEREVRPIDPPQPLPKVDPVPDGTPVPGPKDQDPVKTVPGPEGTPVPAKAEPTPMGVSLPPSPIQVKRRDYVPSPLISR